MANELGCVILLAPTHVPVDLQLAAIARVAGQPLQAMPLQFHVDVRRVFAALFEILRIVVVVSCFRWLPAVRIAQLME